MYTRSQIEGGTGRYTTQWTVILQRGDENVFDTMTKNDGIRSGWHIAGGASPVGQVQWCDLRGTWRGQELLTAHQGV